MTLTLPLTERARKFGYVIWPKSREAEVRAVVGTGPVLRVAVGSDAPRNLTVQWKYARIAVGTKWTHTLPATATTVKITSKEGVIHVTAK